MEAYFKIFNIPISIKSNSPQFLEDFGNIFHYFKTTKSNVDLGNIVPFYVSIDHVSTIAYNNYIVYKSSKYHYIIEYLEHKIYHLIIDKLSNYYLIHAGVIAYNNEATLLPGKSGSGKTTLVAGLIKKGFRYLSDEIAIIDPQTLKIYPFLKPLNMKKGSLSLFKEFEPEMRLISKNDINMEDKIHHIFVNNCSIHPMNKPIPLKNIILIQYNPSIKCKLRPISRASAIFEIARCSFNQYRFREKGINILYDLVKECQCYYLCFNQLSKAINLINDIL